MPEWPQWSTDPGTPYWSYTRYAGFTYRLRCLACRLSLDRQPEGSTYRDGWVQAQEIADINEIDRETYALVVMDIRERLPAYATLAVL